MSTLRSQIGTFVSCNHNNTSTRKWKALNGKRKKTYPTYTLEKECPQDHRFVIRIQHTLLENSGYQGVISPEFDHQKSYSSRLKSQHFLVEIPTGMGFTFFPFFSCFLEAVFPFFSRHLQRLELESFIWLVFVGFWSSACMVFAWYSLDPSPAMLSLSYWAMLHFKHL